jgi:hypothetical protein
MGIESIGWIATLLVIIAMSQSNISRLRQINILACSLFVIYGTLKSAPPVIVLNVIVIAIQAYQEWKFKRRSK